QALGMAKFDKYFKDASDIEILLMEQELITGDYSITIDDIKTFSRLYPYLNSYELDHVDFKHPGHPIHIFIEENKALKNVLERTTHLLTKVEQNPENNESPVMIEDLKHEMSHLGEFRKHYDRKEKLFFPILERYRHFAPTRIMWRGDDRIR